MDEHAPSRPDASVVFMPSGQRGRATVGTVVLDAARQAGLEIESICGGRQTCGRCHVRIEQGRFAKHGIESAADHVSPLGVAEAALLARRALEGQRLACAAEVCGDLLVTVPADSAARKQVIRKAPGVHVIDVAPAVRQVWVEVEPAVFEDARGDDERLVAALTEQWGIDAARVRIDATVLRELPLRLRAGGWTATVTLRSDEPGRSAAGGVEVLDVRAGYEEGVLGVAIDVGSTTIAAHLCDLRTGDIRATAATVNPQVSIGEDLMSRVAHAASAPDGREQLRRAVVAGIDEVVAAVTTEAGAAPSDVYEAVVVGNTVMLHLLLGIDPAELGAAPFSLATRGPVEVKARDLGMTLHPAAVVHMLAAQAGHVGADATAVALACQPHGGPEPTLVVDVGTNAELLLAVNGRLYSASSPTGPAFEGAQITHGMRAAPGAIERVRIDAATGEPRYRVIGSDHWRPMTGDGPPAAGDGPPAAGDGPPAAGICGSGIIEAVAELHLAGIVRDDGRFDPKAMGPRIRRDGRAAAYELARSEETASGRPILVTQADVRAVQLAKAALYAGARLLMARAGIDRVTAVQLAGAFGSYIDPERAMVIGLVPDCDLTAVRAVGNAAGDGARIALLDHHRRVEAATLARDVEYVELAIEPGFQDEFVAAMALPHARDAFPHLGRGPARAVGSPRSGRRPGRGARPATTRTAS